MQTIILLVVCTCFAYGAFPEIPKIPDVKDIIDKLGKDVEDKVTSQGMEYLDKIKDKDLRETARNLLKKRFRGIKKLLTSKGANRTFKSLRFNVKAIAKGAKVLMDHLKDKNKTAEINPVKIVELTADGTEIAEKTLTDLNNLEFGTSAQEEKNCWGVTCLQTLLNVTTKHGELILQVSVFKGEGEIEVENGETYEVFDGSVKINIEISGWKFCGHHQQCTNDVVGDYLEFQMEVKGFNKSGQIKKAMRNVGKRANSLGKAPENFEADGLVVAMAQMATRDQNWIDIEAPIGFKDGNRNIFKCRFPWFNESIYYDPMVEVSTESTGGTNPAVALSHSAYVTIVSLMMVVFKIAFQM